MIFSLTSYSSRVKLVHKTIESLLKQTVRPEKIILWLDESEFDSKSLPDTILSINDSIFSVKYTNNIRSYKKLIPTLRLYPDQIIITFDDDLEYHPELVEKLLEYSSLYPDMIIANRGRYLKRNPDGLANYHSWPPVKNLLPIVSRGNIIPIGFGGILYPPFSLHNDVIKETLFMSKAPYADDLWFFSMALLQNTQTLLMPRGDYSECRVIGGSQEIGLHKTKNLDDGNNKQLAAIIDEYSVIKKYIFDDSRLVSVPVDYCIDMQSDIEKLLSSSFNVNTLRNAALKLEETDVRLALSLLKMAKKLRPNGSLINKKIKEYKKYLNL